MHVLENEDRRKATSGEVVEGGVENGFAAGCAGQRIAEIVAGFASDVIQGRQGMRCEQCLAPSPENPRRALLTTDELADQGGLADPGFAADQRDPPGAGAGPLQRACQQFEVRVAL